MDGTLATPIRYTGRMGIPVFSELGKIIVLRLPCSRNEVHEDHAWWTTGERGDACYSRLSAPGYASLGGDPAERSEMEPAWLMEPGGRACGRLEDTRRAKRLIADDGVEMRSAHLSCFAYQDRNAGVRLPQAALHRAATRSFAHLFVAVPAREARALCQALQGMELVAGPATIFGTGLKPGPLWNINTAEI